MGRKRKKNRGGAPAAEPAEPAAAGEGAAAAGAGGGDATEGGSEPPAEAGATGEGDGPAREPAPGPAPVSGSVPGPAATADAPPAVSPTSRRDFLASAGVVMVGACAVGAAAGAARLAVPDAVQGPPPRFPLGRPSDFKVNTLTWVRERDLFVVRDGAGFGAFSARCTHLGCTVRRTADGFFCPCHGARFDARGAVLGGPAPAPLPWFEVWLEADGRVWVDTARRVVAGTAALVLPDAAPAPGGGAGR